VPNQVRAFVVLDGEGEQLQGPAGGPATIKARAETTNGTPPTLSVPASTVPRPRRRPGPGSDGAPSPPRRRYSSGALQAVYLRGRWSG